jgi:hypothetical protein
MVTEIVKIAGGRKRKGANGEPETSRTLCQINRFLCLPLLYMEFLKQEEA